ncbi:hypothetical protein HHK36_003466 [Tetracentron sinense]|uniref:Uncharacterized protein n=1 Tax=Tetracentron sinense TaxID=13715 RepID=A0A835DS69_TETSI|nr:hypothetical protein HHK36_003466 [Tetracentron sinense]
MKFFFEFASCCGHTGSLDAPTTAPGKEEKRSLMPLHCSGTGSDRFPCPKRDRLTGSKSASAIQWRPSLCAISEDNVVYVVAENAEREVRSGKNVTGKAGSRAKIRVRTHAEEFR